MNEQEEDKIKKILETPSIDNGWFGVAYFLGEITNSLTKEVESMEKICLDNTEFQPDLVKKIKLIKEFINDIRPEEKDK